eukprot:3534619-Rhodomonas_salina.1
MDRATLIEYADLFKLSSAEPALRSELEQCLVLFSDSMAVTVKEEQPERDGNSDNEQESGVKRFNYTDADGNQHKIELPSSLASMLTR